MRGCGLLLLLTCLAGAAGAAEEPEALAGGVNPGYQEKPAWFKQSFLDIREDVAEAAAADKRVLLYFYQDGCPYCAKLLESNFGQRDIAAKTRAHFDVIAINMWGDREVTDMDGEPTTEKGFARELKVMFTPTLLFLDEAGAVVLRINGYFPPHQFDAALDYVGEGLEDEMGFRAYLARTAPEPASEDLHRSSDYLQPPYRLAARDSGKPLVVMFEQGSCPSCDELHQDILRRETSRELLERFDVVLLDMWSRTPVQTPTGRELTARDWARELGVQYAPTLVFFDAAGEEVFRAEAYLKAFHIQSALDYVASGAYREQPSFQRFVQARADALEAQGIHVDLWE